MRPSVLRALWRHAAFMMDRFQAAARKLLRVVSISILRKKTMAQTKLPAHNDSFAIDHKEMSIPALPSPAELIASPSTSFWLRDSLLAALGRDPVDAAADAEMLSQVLSARVDGMVGGAAPK